MGLSSFQEDVSVAVKVEVKAAVKAGKKEAPGTRDQIVAAAADLFYLRGYQGTSLDTVARKAEVNRGSLYYFFRTKKNLGLAVIGHYERLIHLNFIDPVLKGKTVGRGKLERLAALYSHMPRAESPCCGCPIGKLSLELSGIDEDFRLRLKEVWAGVIEGIAVMVREAQAEGALDAETESGEIARSFFGQIQGAHIIARSTLDEGALELDCRRAVENLPWVDKSDKQP
jgi:TetR/AcrR family transcriptional repressor of nem operon